MIYLILALVFLAGPASAAPVTAFLVTAFSSIGFSAAVAASLATYAVNALINVAVGLLVNAIFGGNSAVARGITVMVRESTMPHKLIYGTRRASGPMAYIETTGKDGKYYHVVVLLAAHECNDILKVYFNDDLVWDAGTYQDDWANFARVNFHLGAPDQAADADLAAESDGHWTNDHKISGTAYLYVRLLFDQDKFPQGVPNISALVEGRKIYDPRDGLTKFSANPALCARDYMFDRKHGLAIAADEWDEAACIAMANLSDEAVTTLSGATQARFECNAVIDTSAKHAAVTEAILVTALGGMSYIKGMFTVFGSEYRSPTITLTEGDLAGGVSIQTGVSRRQSYNGVKGKFVSAANNFIEDEYPAVISGAYELADGDPQYISADFMFETDGERAQRNAKILLNKSRQQIAFSANFKLTAFDVVPGDNVMLTMSRYGFSAKVFEVLSVKLNIHEIAPTVTLELRETAAAVYDWLADDADPYLAGPATNLPNPQDITPPNFTVSDELRQQSGGIVSAIVVDLSGYESVFVSTFTVEGKKTGDSEWTTFGSGLQSKFEWVGVTDGETYDLRARVVTLLGARSAYYSTTHYVIGASAVPANVSDFMVDVIGDVAVLKWAAVADLDLSHYRMKFSDATSGATWATAVDLLPNISGTTATVQARAGTYMIKAVDTGGRESANETLVVSSVIGAAVNVVEVIDESAFLGARADLALIDGVLSLGNWSWATDTRDWSTVTENWDSGPFSASGIYNFASSLDLGAVYTSRVSASVSFSRFDSSTSWVTDTRDWSTVTENWGDTLVPDDVSVTVQIRTTMDDPSGSPSWSSWADLILGDHTARAFEFRAVLATDNQMVTPRVTAISAAVDMPDRTYSADDIPTGGTAKVVTYDRPFRAVKSVQVTGQDMATGDYFTVTSRSLSGCTVTFYNSANAITARTFDIDVRGYGEAQ